MNKLIFTLLTIISFSFAINIPLYVDTNWESIQSEAVVIEWQYHDGFPFCRASKEISASINQITELLEDKENYYQTFDRIEYSKLLTPEIVHLIPTLLTDSDSNSALSSKQKRTKERLSAMLFAVYAP